MHASHKPHEGTCEGNDVYTQYAPFCRIAPAPGSSTRSILTDELWC